MTPNVQLVFRGEVLDGFAADEVRRQLAQALKLDEARIAQLFSGTRTVLKRSVEPSLARRYADKLAGLGAKVHLEPSDAPPTTGFAPLPDLPEVPESHTPPPPPWGTPPRPTRPAPLTPWTPPAAPVPIAAARDSISGAALALETLEEVACPNCGERQSKRLLCRNCSTNIEMALANRDEELARARERRQESMNARRAHRSAPVGGGSNDAGIFGLTFDGRMGRLKFATANLVTLALLYIPLIMALQRPTLGRLALLAIVAVVLTVFGMRLAVLRCHDCDKSGWWSILLWLPTVNFIVTLVLAFAPGTDGTNEYGEPPAPASWPAFGVAALCASLLFALSFSTLMTAFERMADDDGDQEAAVQFQYDPRAATLPGSQAQAGFNESYLPARHNKAFAVSQAGAWGWVDGRNSPNDAVRGALQECEARRPAYTGPCVLVNVNGQWATGQ
jgi:uncharacterized membrane protein YhaH (DUF805 family)/predicted RNA-binding Zn-ribbon protein involved in translation (DUF1610 family)